MKAQHKLQGERIHALGISFNSVALGIDMPRSSMNHYFQRGRVADKHRDLPERVERYLRMKTAETARGKTVRGPSLRGKFSQLATTMDYISTETGVDRSDVVRGIREGVWPDAATRDGVTEWIDRAIETTEGKRMITKISLPEEVIEHFGLGRDPFNHEMESVDDIFDTKQLQRAEKKILIAVDKNGWVAITGPVGSGKTVLVKRVRPRLAKRKEVHIVEPQTVEKEYLRVSHVCDSILRDIGPEPKKGQGTLEHRARLVGQTLREAYREGQKVVILIDEAHLLRPEMLLGLKRIYEFEIDFKKLLSIVLVGQQPLARLLKKDLALAEVSQRVDLFELGALNGAIGDYLDHKLARAGLHGNREVFDKSALKAMHERADTPLSLNNLAAAAMIATHDLGEKIVTGEIVKGV